MTRELSDEVKHALRPSASGKTVYFTTGNRHRGDDGVGPFIAERLYTDRKDIVIINAGEKPESFLEEIIRENPTKSVFIDAADFHGEAGEVRMLQPHTLHDLFISTHRFPLRILAQIIEEDTASDVFFIGIQIHRVCFGIQMDRRIEKSAQSIIDFVNGNV